MLRIKIAFFALLACVFANPVWAQTIEFVDTNYVPAPDWVEEIDLDLSGEWPSRNPVDGGSTSILQDYQARYSEDSREMYRRDVFKVSDDTKNEIYLFYDFYSDIQISVHSVNVRKQDGTNILVKPEDLRLRIDGFTPVVVIPDLYPGDIVDIRYTADTSNLINLALLSDSIRLFGKLENLIRIRIHVPTRFNFEVVGLPLEDRVQVETRGEENIYSVFADYRDPETRRPYGDEVDFYPTFIEVSTVSSWSDLSSALHKLTNRRLPPTLDIIKKVEDIRQHTEDPSARLDAAIDFLSESLRINLSYTGVQDYDWVLSDFDEIRKYRECFDFACWALLLSFLEELDLSTDLFLASQRIDSNKLRIQDELIYTDLILRVLVGDEVVWFQGQWLGAFSKIEDGAAPKQPGSYRFILPITVDGAEPIFFETPPADEPHARIESRYDLSDTGVWRLNESVFRQGYPDLDDWVTDAEDRLLWLRRTFPKARLVEASETDFDEGHWDDEIKMSFELPLLGGSQNAAANVRPFFFVEHLPRHFANVVSDLNSEGQSYPDHPQFIEVITQVQMPATATWNASDFEEEVANSYMSFRVKQTRSGDTLTREYSYKTLKDKIPEEDLSRYKVDMERALELTAPWSVSYQPN